MTRREARERFLDGNDGGEGFAPFEREERVAPCVERLQRAGWRLLFEAETTSDVCVLERDGELLGVGGDARGRNAWAVRL